MDTGLVSALANVGAVGVLGYWLVVGLPAVLRDMAAAQQRAIDRLASQHHTDRREIWERILRLSEAVERLALAMQVACRAPGWSRRENDRANPE